MKLNLSKKILISVTIVSMILIFSTNSFTMEGLNVSDEEEIYSSEEIQKINSEYQSKEEAIAESQKLKDEERPPMFGATLPTSSSNATSITGNTPYFTDSYFLTVGSAGYVKLTPTQNYYASIYPIIYDLTMEDILFLTSETSFDDAMAVLGQPHGFRGSGMIGDNYTLIDGTQITVYYTNDTIDQIRSYHEDGSFDILVQ